jgi:hypothetical protein
MYSREDVHGAWWFKTPALLELDQKIKDFCAKISASEKKRVAAKVRKAAKEFTDNPIKKQIYQGERYEQELDEVKQRVKKQNPTGVEVVVKAKSSTGQVRQTSTIEELVSQSQDDFDFKDIEVKIEGCGVWLEINFPSFNSAFSDIYKFNVVIYSSVHQWAEEMQALALKWADQHRLPRRFHLWNKYGFFWPLAGAWAFTPLYSLLKGSPPSHDSYASIRREASEIAATGVNDTNRDKALGLMLKMSTGQPSDPPPPKSTDWLYYGIGIPLLLVGILIFFFPPRHEIDLGQNRRRIKYKSAIYYWSYYPIRILLGGSVLLGILGNLVYDLLKRLSGWG